MKKEHLTIVSQKEIAKQIFELRVTGSLVTQMTTPGQFVHIKVNDGLDPLLRRPISIADVDIEKKELTMIYRAVGKGTKLLSRRAAGEKLDVLGPLGNGFCDAEAKEGETALLVGGGIGVPPLYYLSKKLAEKGVNVVHVLGFSGKDDIFYEEKFSELGQTYVATVDGSYGIKGMVTDVIEKEALEFDVLYACGPVPMLKALDEKYRHQRGFISLEERMGCGIGACFACVCHLQNDSSDKAYKKICSDGPVFRLGEVIL